MTDQLASGPTIVLIDQRADEPNHSKLMEQIKRTKNGRISTQFPFLG